MNTRILSAVALSVFAAGCASSLTLNEQPTGPRLACARADLQSPSEVLCAAGGGRPQTGYIGVSLAALIPASDELSSAWAADVNYNHNLSERFAFELALGTSGASVERAAVDGTLRSTTLSAFAQTGSSFGSSRWFLGAGLLYYLNDLSGFGGTTADDAVGGALSGGLDMHISPHATIVVELRYLMMSAPLSAGDDLDLGGLATRINYVFVY